MEKPDPSRRSFLAATAKLASTSWIAMHWPQIAAAQEMSHAGHDMAAAPGPKTLSTLTAAEGADVDAISNQIVPGGETPGARAAHAVMFIDNALGSFFKDQQPSFRKGLADFQAAYAAKTGAAMPFAHASDAQQIAYLQTVDKTPFFLAVRRLTVLGIIAMPKYGGNFEGVGNKLIGVIDRHVWRPPFGFYDRDYAGFTPYPGTTIQTA